MIRTVVLSLHWVGHETGVLQAQGLKRTRPVLWINCGSCRPAADNASLKRFSWPTVTSQLRCIGRGYIWEMLYLKMCRAKQINLLAQGLHFLDYNQAVARNHTKGVFPT